MNILEFGRSYATKYPDRVSELRDLYQQYSKPVMLNMVIEKYPKLFDKLLRIVGTTFRSKIDRVMMYQFLYPNERTTCLTCGNPTNFAPEFKRFREFCCKACRDSNPIIEQRRKETIVSLYGSDNIFKTEIFKKQAKKTMLSLYGVENCSQSKVFVAKKSATMLENFGVAHHTQTEEYRKNFSENNPMYDKDNKKKQRKTNKKKYGFTNASKNPEVIAKINATHLERYGCNAGALVAESLKYKAKLVTDRFGIEHRVQGYEDRAVKYLSKIGFITKITTGSRNVGNIFYKKSCGTAAKYYPDMVVTTTKGNKHLIEVKSDFTLFNPLGEGYFINCLLKFAAATRYMKKRGGCFWLYYYDSKGKLFRVKNPTCERDLTDAGVVNPF